MPYSKLVERIQTDGCQKVLLSNEWVKCYPKSSATQTQANATNKVAQNMQDILEITRQTTRGTQQAAGSIRDLAAVAQELKSSVSGFKL